MDFDINELIQNPQFQTGLGLLGAASPKNRPLFEAYNMMQQMQHRKQEQERIKQYMELQQAQENRLNQQADLYRQQIELQRRGLGQKEAADKFWQEQIMPRVLQQFGSPQQITQPPSAPMPQPPISQGGTTPTPTGEIPQGNFPMPGQSTLSGSKIFNLADKFVAGVEGGFTPNDAGRGPTNFGINQQANPTVDVRNLTEAAAQQIRKRYWDNIQGDQITQVYSPQTAMVAYDAAINQGPDYAKSLVEKTGGNPTLMLYQRRQDYRGLAKNPMKTQYLKGWEDRLDQLGQQIKDLQSSPTAQTPETQSVQPQPPVGDMNQYRTMLNLAGAMKGMGGDYSGALEAMAKGLEPKGYAAGTFISTPQGITRIPNPEEQERLRNDAERLRLEKERLNKPPEGYERLPNGELKAIKGGPAEAKLTEAEGKATTYYDQMTTARKVLEGLEKQGWDPKTTLSQLGTAFAGGILNPVTTAQQQQAKQAQEQWAEAYLRFKTGAATNTDEINRNIRTFFPQLGDAAETVKQKEKARKDAEAAIAISAGRGLAKLPSRNTGSYSDPEKERRYQEWKARQGQ